MKKILKGLGFEQAELSILLCTREEIAALNLQYLGKNRPTDVLSFSQLDEQQQIMVRKGQLADLQKQNQGLPLILGDVVLAPEVIKLQAHEHGVPYFRELTFLAIHGLLHLLGYNHEAEDQKEMSQMFTLQDKLLQGCYQRRLK